MHTAKLVSIHGGHSGQFCNHAQNTLEDIILAYIERGFAWVGITEHIPPVNNDLLYPEEVEAGLTADSTYTRFADYMATCRQLQQKYAAHLDILVGFETEAFQGYEAFVKQLVADFSPDYMVGSVHHVNNIPFDLSPEVYRSAANMIGGLDTLYCRYFDQQDEMLQTLKPQVVGHFDLIRKYDPNYLVRLQQPEIATRIRRNLETIKELNLILDFNVRALAKGAIEPYVARPILHQAQALGIPLVPGDDSHSVAEVGLNIAEGIAILAELGVSTEWVKPTKR